ncbi:multidrug effflux MFS transporter [Paracoccus sanguinis]|uniref:Bcr/CflA family efflux transporter n=1 Tax=Paracoccus sanguinis TaxID=1545044 RepID=A0A1H2SGC5_9RHOB|nr:multidrug effflux MFS transporter [Paracoccus sanguinis]KGJ18332.1 multidrug MFS transporter [Paracoccus sanguinis]SDW30555.1 MFS transporter, DHA1 family, bicyclomycin/chloramphenicol resistance protein [Paracoccus sanguinis]
MTGAEAARPRRTPPHILTLVLLSGLGALSMNVFLPSLPGMARDFGVDYAVMQLSVTVYLAGSALVQMIAGPLSDRYGRRPVMLVGLATFLVATAGTLLAPSAGWFLAFRTLQAAVGTGMVLSRAIVHDMVEGDAAASRIGYVTMGMSVIPMMAPILGGLLDEAFGWRANFAMLLAAGAAALALAWVDLGETARGGLSMRAQMRGYPQLARSGVFWGYALAATFASGAFFAYLGGAPFVGETVFHLRPAEVGYWFAAPSIGYLLGNFISGRFAARVGIDRMILLGAWVTALALGAALAVTMAGALVPAVFFGAIALMGLGNGMVLPSATAGMMGVRPELAGTASGLGGAMAVAGGAGLAALAGRFLVPGAGATPLLCIMALSAAASLGAIMVVRRLRRPV